MNGLLLRASQIVISYADAQPFGGPVPFALSARSKSDALRVVRSLRRVLKNDPTKFAELANKYSDEPVSAAMGGALGNFYALAMPRETIDALGQIKVGEVSRIVETGQGYQLLLREAVETDGKLAFAHVVIKHIDATGFTRCDRKLTDHTREEANAIAHEVAALAERKPDAFSQLVQQYSEAEDALRDGDMGLWSRSELLEREFLLFEVASRLAIGAVSSVIETPSGFHVLRRTSEQERQQLAMSAITILHRESQFQKVDARATRTKAEAAGRARQLLTELKARPQTFARRQREDCEIAFCDGVFGFEEGRGPPAAERALRQLKVGEVAPQPIDTPFGLVLLRREDPALAPKVAQKLHTEFGASDSAGKQAAINVAGAPGDSAPAETRKTPEQLADDVRRFERYAFRKMRLSGTERSGVTAILDEFVRAVAAAGNGDLGADARRADERLAQLLGPQKHQELTRHRMAFFSEQGP